MDHARVVGILRKADHLPLIKEYLLAVQKANLAAVNEAVNELLIEEEDFAALRDSITTYDNYDQISLATRLERHDLMEFRRIAAHIYKSNLRWRKAVALAKQDRLYKVRTALCLEKSRGYGWMMYSPCNLCASYMTALRLGINVFTFCHQGDSTNMSTHLCETYS